MYPTCLPDDGRGVHCRPFILCYYGSFSRFLCSYLGLFHARPARCRCLRDPKKESMDETRAVLSSQRRSEPRNPVEMNNGSSRPAATLYGLATALYVDRATMAATLQHLNAPPSPSVSQRHRAGRRLAAPFYPCLRRHTHTSPQRQSRRWGVVVSGVVSPLPRYLASVARPH